MILIFFAWIITIADATTDVTEPLDNEQLSSGTLIHRLLERVSVLEARDQKPIEHVSVLEARVQILLEHLNVLEEREKRLLEHVSVLEARQQKLIKRLSVLEDRDKSQQREIHGLRLGLTKQKKLLSSLHQQVVKKDERTLPHSYRRTDEVGSTAYINQTGPSSNRKFTNSKPTGSDEGKRIRRADVETKVAFTAGLSHSILHAGEHQNIVFDYVEINIGDGYNPHHGVFIAPVTGTYVFYTSVMAESNREIWCQIMVNGVRKVTAYARGTDNRFDQGSQAIVVQLQKGDDVAVQNYTPDDAIFSNQDIWTSFSGFLLYQG